jgi:diguanylate cyclase (GGDEF)-like protein
MKKEYIQDMLSSLPVGVGYLRLLFDSDNEVADYMYLDLNSAFEELSGWKWDEIVNKSAFSVWGTDSVYLYWLNYYTNVFLSGKTKEVVRWSRKLKQFITITVIPSEENLLVVILRKSQKAWADDKEKQFINDKRCVGIEQKVYLEQETADTGDSKKIKFLTCHDVLTGLYNRSYMETIINNFDTVEHLPISVIMGDVNGLKFVNDVFGYETGDALLQEAACLLARYCGDNSKIARWGGDEFVVLMPETPLQTAEKIIQDMKNTEVRINDNKLELSLSLGCASKTLDKENVRTVLKEAEEHMYHQKLLDEKSCRNAIINTLLVTLYEQSNETEEHSKRIERYCHSMGRILKFSTKEMDELSLLALLHDIGKVSINPSILQKPGPLTAEEWKEMKKHPEIGYRIVQSMPELTAVSKLVLSHHERWDGKGYPHGLKGEDIPLACRILAVADAFDAMTNNRVYRRAMTAREAMNELLKHAGTQFDTEIVKLFIRILKNNEEHIYRDRYLAEKFSKLK